MEFSKPHRSFNEQIEGLRERGLLVHDQERASRYLSNINYYRLGTYWWTFEADHSNHQFKPNTTFEQVLELYVFDRELRLIVLDAIERIEISLRTQWAYQLSMHDGAHAHLNPHLFNHKFDHNKLKETLKEELSRNKDKHIKRQKEKYEEETPAIWIICELMSFGWLSKSFQGIQRRDIRNEIARHFGLTETTLVSFLHHLVLVRNVCAHHARLWNRDFTVKFKIPKHIDAELKSTFNQFSTKKLYNSLVLTSFIMNKICPDSTWTQRLVKLLNKYRNIPKSDMGFPDNWQNYTLWKEN